MRLFHRLGFSSLLKETRQYYKFSINGVGGRKKEWWEKGWKEGQKGEEKEGGYGELGSNLPYEICDELVQLPAPREAPSAR